MNKLSPHSQKQQLKQEIWFHGSVSRAEAESMLTRVNIEINFLFVLIFVFILYYIMLYYIVLLYYKILQ